MSKYVTSTVLDVDAHGEIQQQQTGKYTVIALSDAEGLVYVLGGIYTTEGGKGFRRRKARATG